MAKVRQGPFELFWAKNYGASGINEHDIADPEQRSLLVLGDERLTAKRKENEIVICIIEANVTIDALDATGIASCLQCLKSTDLDRANPASERVGFDTFRVVSFETDDIDTLNSRADLEAFFCDRARARP